MQACTYLGCPRRRRCRRMVRLQGYSPGGSNHCQLAAVAPSLPHPHATRTPVWQCPKLHLPLRRGPFRVELAAPNPFTPPGCRASPLPATRDLLLWERPEVPGIQKVSVAQERGFGHLQFAQLGAGKLLSTHSYVGLISPTQKAMLLPAILAIWKLANVGFVHFAMKSFRTLYLKPTANFTTSRICCGCDFNYCHASTNRTSTIRSNDPRRPC